MWKIFKAELRYFKWLVGATAILYEALMHYYFVVENASWFPARSIWHLKYHHMVKIQLLFFLIYLMIFQGSRFATKHDRIYASIPVKYWLVGLLRMIESLIAWSGIVTVFILHAVAFNHDCLAQITPGDVMTLTGWIVILNAVYMIAVDIRYSAVSGRTIVGLDAVSITFFSIYGAWIVLWIAANSLMNRFDSINALDPYYNAVRQFTVSGAGIAVVLAIGIVLSFAAVETFIRRRSYLA